VQWVQAEDPGDEEGSERKTRLHAVGVSEDKPAEDKEEIEQNLVAPKKRQLDEGVNDMQMEEHDQQCANTSETIECGKSLNRLHSATSVLVYEKTPPLAELEPVQGILFGLPSTVEIFHP
jgi:hypothetical protein